MVVLSAGVALRLLRDDRGAVPCRLQVVHMRRVVSDKGPPRFVLGLSDGRHAIDSVLATALNDLGGVLRCRAVVEVLDFAVGVVQPTGVRVCVVVRALLVCDLVPLVHG